MKVLSRSSSRILFFFLALCLIFLSSFCQAIRLPERFSAHDHGSKGKGVTGSSLSNSLPLVSSSPNSPLPSTINTASKKAAENNINVVPIVDFQQEESTKKQQQPHQIRIHSSQLSFKPSAEKFQRGGGGGVPSGGKKYEDVMDMTEMDYSPVKRKPPIHN